MSKSDEKGSKQYRLEELLRLAAAEGARVALETVEREKKKALKNQQDKRYHNAKLLLKNYRVFKAIAENAVYDASTIEENALTLLNLMMNTWNDDVTVSSIQRSAIRTAIIVEHIEKMIQVYEVLCEKSKKPEDKRYYRIIYNFYIADEPMSAKDIADSEGLTIRGVYANIDAAMVTIAALIWGIDGTKI